MFALLAEVLLVRSRLLITPNYFNCEELVEKRKKFLPLLEGSDRWIFLLTIVGTIIWAYGDIPFTWIERWVQATCGIPLK